MPANSSALIVFVHGSGSSRLSLRNVAVSKALNAAGMATLLFDLLTQQEERNRNNIFDIPLLAHRLIEVIIWVDQEPRVARLPLGLFGASTGAAAALVAAAKLGRRIGAIVSRGGRPDLADEALDRVETPTLLVVGGDDLPVVELNQHAFTRLNAPKALAIIPGASHLFPEPGALDAVIEHATRWFFSHLVTGVVVTHRKVR